MAGTLLETLQELDPDLVLSDGADDWEVEALIDAIAEADEADEDKCEYVLGRLSDGRVVVERLDDDGYRVSPPAYVERRSDTGERLDAAYMEVAGTSSGHGSRAWIARYVDADDRTVRRWLEPGGDTSRLAAALDLYEEGKRIGREQAIEELREKLSA